MLLPGLIGEMQLRIASYRQLEALVRGEQAMGYQGSPLPEIAWIDHDGRRLTNGEALRAGDVLALVGRRCPHCSSLAPHLAALDDSLRAEGRRVVLAVVNSATVPSA